MVLLVPTFQSCTIDRGMTSVSGDVVFDPTAFRIVVGVFPSTHEFNTALDGEIVSLEQGGATVIMLNADLIDATAGGVEPYDLTFPDDSSEVGGIIAFIDEDADRVFDFPLEQGWLPVKRIGGSDTIVLRILFDDTIDDFRVHYSLNGNTVAATPTINEVGSSAYDFILSGP